MLKCNIIVYFILIITITSCSLLGSDSNKSKIVGQWGWVKSTGGFVGHTITPDSAGYSKQQLHYGPDHEFSFFRADTLVVSGIYELQRENGHIVVKYDKSYPPSQRIEFGGSDTLILIDECADCSIHTYKRNK